MAIKNIVALIDLSELSSKVIDQTALIAKQLNTKAVVCYVSENPAGKDQEKLDSYSNQLSGKGIETSSHLAQGNFNNDITYILNKLEAELVIVGTHGQKGIKQNLFGSNIWKLVNSIPCSVFVISQFTSISTEGIRSILMPVGPHAEFASKLEMCADLAGSQGKISIFAIEKPGIVLSDSIFKTITESKKYFEEKSIQSELIEFESVHFSTGYAKETLSYAKDHSMDAIAILTRVAEENSHFGKLDKEAMVVNESGIPILCIK